MSQAQLDDIKNAYYRINKYLNRTELVSSELLNKEIGAQVYLKPEQLQKTGSFKIRGALSAMTLLDKKQLQNGVIAFSSGNHAQGIAYAAKLLNMCEDDVRLPLVKVTDQTKEIVKKSLQSAKLI